MHDPLLQRTFQGRGQYFKIALELRGEAFDLTNTTTFNPPNALLGTATYRTVTGVRNSGRQVQIALKIHF
jgi:hypothetical protein